ncbi:hypothetical protein HS088_TW20G00209 [Tripterygium wilfordii]|uniref:Uncharacterized protein n=1 Tax=Tripterygium wilfordii TaxID=458696 RepID=A0A7J7C6S7_TRIWF|nr:hypothetical protein HS088_TW20G00209 [Tripterygium wilfordii]
MILAIEASSWLIGGVVTLDDDDDEMLDSFMASLETNDGIVEGVDQALGDADGEDDIDVEDDFVEDSVRAGMHGIYVAATQCSGDGEDDIVPEYNVEELPFAFTGYTLLHLSRALIIPFYCTLCFECT